MVKITCKYLKISIAMLCIIFAVSCANNSADIPFPSQGVNFKPPVSQPLQFTPPKKINWVTTKTGGIKSVIKPFDLGTLPSQSYDSIDFKPFNQPVTTTRFNFNSLPGASFNFDSIQSKSLHFKTAVFNTPDIAPAGVPFLKTGSPLAIFDMGPRQGIRGATVSGLLKSKSGLIWIATDEALYRFDGEHIQTYLTGLSTNFINGMVEDNNGALWFIQHSGLGMIDPARGTISHMNGITAPTNNLAKMLKDDDGRIWVCDAEGRGALVIDPATQTYKEFDKTTGLSGAGSFGAMEDSEKNIWVTTPQNGVSIINIKAGKIKYLAKANGLNSDSLSAITQDKNGHVWIAIAGNSNTGLDELNIKDGLVTHYTNAQGIKNGYTLDLLPADNGYIWMASITAIDLVDPQRAMIKHISPKSGLSAFTTITLLLDDNKRVWAGTSKGLNIIEQDGELVHPVDNRSVSTMTEDSQGNIWVGSANGVRIIDTQKKLVRYLDKQHGLGNNFTQSFTEDEGNIWITNNGGLDVIDPVHKTIAHTGRAEGLTSDTVYGLLRDKAGDVWFTGPSLGIDVMDKQKTFIKHAGIAEGLSDDAMADIKQDSEGRVWLATIRAGVDVINPQDGTIKYLNNAPGLRDTCNRILLPDEEGRMWIGTDKGIYIADARANTLTSISTEQGLNGNKIISLLERDGKIFAATPNGVSIIWQEAASGADSKDSSTKQWRVEPLSRSEWLVKEAGNSWATNAITKKGQYLWGDSGVSIINGIKGYTANAPVYITGMQIMDERQKFLTSPRLNENDTLWGRDTFYVEGQVPAGIASYKQAGLSWDSVAGPYNMPVNLHIPYNKNYIQFQFVQAHTGNMGTPAYCYLLQGIDKQWSDITTNTFTENYLNLPPGAYTLKVSSRSANGKWSEPAAFSFTIMPPWWKTWWAYTIYILAILFAVWLFVQYRSRKLVSENLLLEEKVKQRTDALQHSLEELKTTQSQLVQSEKMASLGELTAGIAHEIQNPLNFVNNFSEVSIELVEELKEELDKMALDAGVKENITILLNDLVQNQQKINYHGKRADSIVKGMLQHSRTGSGQKELYDINVLADEYLRLSYHGLRAKDKAFNAKLETNFDANLPKVHILLQDMGRVLLNLYNNAFYSVMKKKKEGGDSSYQPMVTITTQKSGNQVEIRVRDNGMGIPQHVLDKIYNPFFTTKPTGEGTGLGLSLSYEIVTKGHGGTINAETKEGEFAEFIIRLPI